MEQVTSISTVAHMIQLSVAPVFLLLAIGSMLAVVTNRLGRVIDRGHALEKPLADGDAVSEWLREQFGVLARRAKFAYGAITLFTIASLLVCTVIVILFLGALFDFNTSQPVAVLYIIAMLGFIAGLMCFIAEIRVATQNLRIGHRR